MATVGGGSTDGSFARLWRRYRSWGQVALAVVFVAFLGVVTLAALGGAAPTVPVSESVVDGLANYLPAGGAAPALAPVGSDDQSEPSGESSGVRDARGSTVRKKPAEGEADTDGDGLSDATERKLGTDPRHPDTDGDGHTDGQEVRCTASIPGADPLVNDVYVELDTTRNISVDAETLDRVKHTFATAPVTNPDGSTGIRLHVRRSDTDLTVADALYSEPRAGGANDLRDFRRAHFDSASEGHFYVVAAEEVAYDGDTYYAGAGRPGIAAIETFRRPETTASLLMHELGHAFGLDADQDGIDSDTYSVESYTSVMNYNGIYQVLGYADGSGAVGRDEWAFVATDRYQPELTCDA